MPSERNFKSEYEKIFTENIKREGASALLEYIKTTDFFTAPASTRFHSNFQGGLVEHTVKVYNRFLKMLEYEYGKKWIEKPENQETAAVIALLHDLCKVNCYKTEMRNVKVGNEWIKQPFFSFDDPLPYGHGEKSVYMICGYIKLTREEAMSINWHMGAFDPRAAGKDYVMNNAFKQYPIAVLFHSADFLTSYLDEEVKK